MDLCRICLSEKVCKDINHLESNVEGDAKEFSEIILFCLNIEINLKQSITTKLCMKCYKQTLAFYKFKHLAIKNNEYLQNLDLQASLNQRCEVYLKEDNIKKELQAKETLDEGIYVLGVKEEGICDDIKAEVELTDSNNDSEDEFLIVIKQNKSGDGHEESKENAPIQRRGRKKNNGAKSTKTAQVCEECGKFVRNLKEHSHRHTAIADRRLIQCPSCNKTFSSYSARYKHFKTKHLGIKYKCNICNKVVASLRSHQLTVHNTEALKFKCISCNKKFISQSSLNVHTRTHTKDRPYECNICHSKFRTNAVMIMHIRQVHNQERSHLCQYCSKSFFKKYHLQIHLRSHTKESPYKCEECGKMFRTPGSLSNHKLIHTGVKNFACDLCDMTFYRSASLRTHMVSHTKERRHPCQYCGVLFGRSDHRLRHEKTAHLKHLQS